MDEEFLFFGIDYILILYQASRKAYAMTHKNIQANIFFKMNLSKLLPSNVVDVAYTINQRDWSKAAWSMTSLLIHNNDIDFHFHVCIPYHNADKIYTQYLKELKIIKPYILTIHPIKFEDLTFPNFSQRKLTYVHIMKMFLAKITDVDRVLFLDADTINIRPLDLLITLNITKYVIAGVIAFNMYPTLWINSGVIIYNLKAMRENSSYMIYVNCTSSRRWDDYYDDVMHTFCFDNISRYILPSRYNVMAHHIGRAKGEYLRSEQEKAVILHFMVDAKNIYRKPFDRSFKNHIYDAQKREAMEEFFKVSDVIAAKLPHFQKIPL